MSGPEYWQHPHGEISGCCPSGAGIVTGKPVYESRIRKLLVWFPATDEVEAVEADRPRPSPESNGAGHTRAVTRPGALQPCGFPGFGASRGPVSRRGVTD